LTGPTKELERLVLTGKLQHGNNPVLNWMCANAVAEQDPAGNVKLSKSKSADKIDGMSALVNAVAGTIADESLSDSVYEERGILVV
jgi:phage terminase large subunit-like protein